MPNIIKVDTKDKLRTLLTDVLPYELPLWFTNFNMHKRFSTKEHANAYKSISGLDFESDAGVYIPLDYLVSRGGDKANRTISIMHPAAQIKTCAFYNDYDDLIEYYCSKSKFSLRHPKRKSTQFYGKVQTGSRITAGVESMDEERVVSSSYFKYEKHPFLYRFFESYEYHQLEKQFPSMLQVDISKCFPSIYTHSIGWAVKNKRLSKSKPRARGNFDGDFDNLMQLTNYRETNGILIGPEVSRIFAEIILQKIDIDVENKMGKHGLLISKHYDFRRYVDDYFFFFRSFEAKAKFIKSLELCLLEYKMHLNETKTTIASRPFATDISLAKHALNKAVLAYCNLRYKPTIASPIEISKLSSPNSAANKAIAEIKMALANHKVEYHSISNYLFSAITKRMQQYLNQLSKTHPIEEFHANWILVDLEILFFVHAMDIRIRTTDRLARLIHTLVEQIEDWPSELKEIIHKKIFDHVKQAINIFISSNGDGLIGLETLNLLIILSILPERYKLTEEKLNEYLGSLEKDPDSNDLYFRWITFMLYIKGDSKYNAIREKLIKAGADYLTSSIDMFRSSEYFMFYFDYVACPHIDKKERLEIVEKVKNMTVDDKSNPVQFNVKSKSKIILNNDFIVSWRDKHYLKSSLEKKEYVFAYN